MQSKINQFHKFYTFMWTISEILEPMYALWYIVIMDNILYYIFPNENFIDLCLYQYGWEKCDPGHSFGPSTRNHYLFHYVISGTGTLIAADSKGMNQTFHIKSGQGFLIYPGCITHYFADVNIPWEYTWLEFDGLRVKEALDLTNLSMDNPVYHSRSAELRELMKDEMLYIVKHTGESPFSLIGHLYLFFDYLTSSCRREQFVQSERMSDYYIKEAINYIEQNFQNDISIENIAKICGINRSYLGKIFKKTIGRTPQEFLMNYRMTKAAELLKLTELSIADIGCAVGYENQLHFSRAFKHIYGVSPRNWRQIHKTGSS